MHIPVQLARGLALGAALTLGGLTSHAQQQPPRSTERGADLLSLQIGVVTQDGTPVTDLRAEELQVRIGGRVRPIRSLQFIEVTGSAPDGNTAVPLPFATNAVQAAGRTIVLAIDDDSFRPGSEGPLRDATAALVSRLNEADRVAVVTMPYGGTKVPLTSDHSRVRNAMNSLVGQAPATQTGSDLACRSRRTLESLVTYLDSLGIRQDAVTVLFVTSALAAPRRDAAFARAPGMCELPETLFNQVGQAAGAARAQFYVIRPGDAADGGNVALRETVAGSDNPIAGIDHLAGVTGGKLLSLTNSSGFATERVARETAGHYLVTMDATANDRTGRTQQMDVRVSRRGTEVRAHPHITFAKPDVVTSKLLQPSLRDMLGTPALFRDLPMRAVAFPALTADDKNIRVVALAEPTEPGTQLSTLGAVLVDQDGKVAAQWLATPEELGKSPVMGAMSVPTGAYRFRVAAIDATGRAGTVDYDVTADLATSGPLKISSLVLGLNREGGFTPRLQFTNEPLAIAYLEMEGAPAGARVSAAVEIAQSINGPAIVTVPLAIENTGGSRYTATGSLAVGALPPGDYIARAIVGMEGHPPTMVVRTVRKAVLAGSAPLR
jgi:VWFA-related protein